MLEILNLMVHQSLGNLREKKNLICSSVIIYDQVCLFTAILLAGVFYGSFYTASNSLVLYMLGPERSPPFIQSLHAMVALGFMLGSLLIRPFVPDNQAPVNI